MTAAAPSAEVDWPPHWRDRRSFVVLAAGPEAWSVLLDAWAAWRGDPRRCARLDLIGIVPDWAGAADLASAVTSEPRRAANAERLTAALPPCTPNLHAFGFDAGRVQWLLAPGRALDWLPRLSAAFDACVLHAEASGWPRGTFKRLARLAANGAWLRLPAPSDGAGDELRSAGFAMEPAALGGAVRVGRFEPAFAPRRSAGRDLRAAQDGSRSVIVGAGLAGCACAWALAERGLRCTVLERHAGPAAEASGNPAGLFHGVVHGRDGRHARFNRAAALEATAAVRMAIERHGVAGSASGLLRLEPTLAFPEMHALLASLRLPDDHVQALDATAATARAGIGLGSPAWFFPGGGWVDPAGLARSFLDRAGPMATLRCGIQVDRIEPVGQSRGTSWRLLAADGGVIEEAATLVLANAGDGLRLLGGPNWPVDAVRGQLSGFDAAVLPWTRPKMPIAGQGYVIPAADGTVWFGATSQTGDGDPTVRRGDHADNLARLGRLFGRDVGIAPDSLVGRTAWRSVARDRLPIIGAVPDAVTAAAPASTVGSCAARSRRPDQARHVPRLAGLFICSGFGSRGITVAALAARVLAALVTGAPVALENDLLEAVDPARFLARDARRPAGNGS